MIDAVASDYQDTITFLGVAGKSSEEASRTRVGAWFSPDRILWGYDEDVGIDGHADVLFFADFETGDGSEGWTHAGGSFETVDTDPGLGFEPLSGRALKVLMAEGANLALSLRYQFVNAMLPSATLYNSTQSSE